MVKKQRGVKAEKAGGPERLRNLPKVTQLVIGKPRMEGASQAPRLHSGMLDGQEHAEVSRGRLDQGGEKGYQVGRH